MDLAGQSAAVHKSTSGSWPSSELAIWSLGAGADAALAEAVAIDLAVVPFERSSLSGLELLTAPQRRPWTPRRRKPIAGR
jgi:hypothetical protein